MGDLDGVPVDAHQPGVDELLDQPDVGLVHRDLGPRHPGRHRVAVLAGHHQAQEQAAEPATLGVVHGVVQRLRRLRDGMLDPARGEVARHGQRRTLAALPRLAQHVGQQRQRGGLALDLADQQVDQPRFELEAGPARGPLNGAAQVGLAQRAEQVEAVLQDPGDVGVGG